MAIKWITKVYERDFIIDSEILEISAAYIKRYPQYTMQGLNIDRKVDGSGTFTIRFYKVLSE